MNDIENGKSYKKELSAARKTIEANKKSMAEKDSIIEVMSQYDTTQMNIIAGRSFNAGILKKQLADCNAETAKMKKAIKKSKKIKNFFKLLTAVVTVASGFLIVKK